MSVTEGIGKPIGYALVLGGLVVAAWWFLKDFDWSSLNPFKDFKSPDVFVNVNNVLDSPIPGVPVIPEENQPDNPVSPSGANVTPSEVITGLNPVLGIPTAILQILDTLGLHPAKEEYIPPVTGPGMNPPSIVGTASQYLKDAIKADTSGYLGGYLEPVGWVDEKDTPTKYDYPLWKDIYTNELMVGWDVNHIRSLDNLLLTDIRLGEEGRHTWWLT